MAINAIEVIQRLPGLHFLELVYQLILEAANLAAELGLKGADSNYVTAAKKLNIPLDTYDKEQSHPSQEYFT